MSRIPILALFIAVWLADFLATQFEPVRAWIGVPLFLLPALVVYASLSHSLAETTALSFLGSIGFDALGPGRLGVSLMPVMLLGFVVHFRRSLILRDQAYAQFWMGFFGGLFALAGTWIVAGNHVPPPAGGWRCLWHLFVLGILNGVACPACFLVFDGIRKTFDYQPIGGSSFRPDRIILRGKT